MNQIKSLFLIVIFSFSSMTFAQMKWKEKDDYHHIMAGTFHPAEEGNFAPIKNKSAELVAKAKAWKNSEIPSDVMDKKSVKSNLKKLYKDSKNLHRKVNKGFADRELKNDLFALHDTFHTIVGLCNAKEKHHEEAGHGNH